MGSPFHKKFQSERTFGFFRLLQGLLPVCAPGYQIRHADGLLGSPAREACRFLSGNPFPPNLWTFGLFQGDGLTEAGFFLSAARFSGMAAAILKIFQLYPVVAQKQPNFLGPGLRAG
jgi:hypothetical protein